MGANDWHHFVPEMYLKGFLDPTQVAMNQNVLWVYEQGKKIRSKGAGVVAGEHGFYYARDYEGAEDMVEPLLSKMEDVAVKHLEWLRGGNFPPNERQKTEIATYLGNQRFRTRVFRELLNAAVVDGFRRSCRKVLGEGRVAELVEAERIDQGISPPVDLDSMEAFVRGMADGTTELTQSGKAWTILKAFEGGEELAGHPRNMRWILIEGPEDEPFITCDNPVYLSNGAPRPNKPLYTADIQMIFPVSPRYLLFAEFNKRPDAKQRVKADFVRSVRFPVFERAHQQVYASFFSKELQAEVSNAFAIRDSPFDGLG